MRGKIAVEEHFGIEDTLRESAEYALPGQLNVLERRLLDLGDERLREMDAHDIGFAILSLNAPGAQSVCDRTRAIDIARRGNDALAAGVARHPDRFAGFAALPMQDPEAASAELTRAVKELGFKGAVVNGFSQIGDPDTVVYYDDPMYRSFWATAEGLGVPFYLHPRDPLPGRMPIYEGHPWLTGRVVGIRRRDGDARAAADGERHLRRASEAHVILGHLGEGLPYQHLAVRSPGHQSAARGIPAKRIFAEYLRSNFYVTTSGNFHTSTLACAIAEMGADRVLFSVDYPYEEVADAAAWFDKAEISEEDRLKIGRTNAATLFKIA